ncbi:hypothetical protein [Gordonia polyisoprenivorans]|uniref:hypothetical protein n=1 Tax=Gordonia polyisoprenivorans TaxID=84595 RepID=UPI0011D26AD7|nr:hypothetical protein [Gordonia polyisoprenivorans]
MHRTPEDIQRDITRIEDQLDRGVGARELASLTNALRRLRLEADRKDPPRKSWTPAQLDEWRGFFADVTTVADHTHDPGLIDRIAPGTLDAPSEECPIIPGTDLWEFLRRLYEKRAVVDAYADDDEEGGGVPALV